MKKISLLLSLVSVLGIALTGCNNDEDDDGDNEPLEVKEFNVVEFETNQNISLSLSECVGGTINNDEKKVNSKNKFTDGSFDHNTAKIYTPRADGKGLDDGEKAEFSLYNPSLESLLLRQDNKSFKVYTAFVLSLSFKHTFVEEENSLGLFINTSLLEGIAKSRFELVEPEGSEPKTGKALRVALLPKDSEDANTKVLALFRDKDDCTHLDGTIRIGWTEENHFGGVAYGDELIDKNYHVDLPTSGDLNSYTNRPDYIGKFDASKKDANNEVELKYTMVMWYEGTDPLLVNSDSYDSVMAHLSFDGVTLPSA